MLDLSGWIGGYLLCVGPERAAGGGEDFGIAGAVISILGEYRVVVLGNKYCEHNKDIL